jgi:hypothetical protein
MRGHSELRHPLVQRKNQYATAGLIFCGASSFRWFVHNLVLTARINPRQGTMKSVLPALVAFLCVFQSFALKCAEIPDKSVPCSEIPRCSSDAGEVAKITIDQLSTGAGASQATSTVSMCFTDTELKVTHKAMGQKYLSATSYTECNDSIFNSDVAEFFVAPNMEQEPHCYNELDISPYNVMFDSGVYNPNLNHTGIQGTTFPCATSNITSDTTIDMSQNQWTAHLTFPFSLLNCPYNCPLKR